MDAWNIECFTTDPCLTRNTIVVTFLKSLSVDQMHDFVVLKYHPVFLLHHLSATTSVADMTTDVFK